MYNTQYANINTCENGNEVIKEPIELGGGIVATLSGGCTDCNEPPCLHYASCYALRKCRTGDPAQDGIRNVSTSGGSGTTSCGVSYSTLACSTSAIDYYNRYLYHNQDPQQTPQELFADLSAPDNRPLCSCENGATNYPTCDECPAGEALDGSNQCVSATCPGGQINPPVCDQMGAVCGTSGSVSDVSDITPCSSGTLDGSIIFTKATGSWSWSCQHPSSPTIGCGAQLQCANGFTYSSASGNCEPSSCAGNPDCASGYNCIDSQCTPVGAVPPGGSGGCFVAGTQVSLAGGTTKNIEDVAVGDQVVSYDEELRMTRIDTVIETLHHEERVQRLYTFTLENGVDFTSNDVHPIYVVEKDKYIMADSIYMRYVGGESIHFQDIHGNAIGVQKISIEERFVAVYNLDIAGRTLFHWKYPEGIGHNYYVNGILVHNPEGESSIIKN